MKNLGLRVYYTQNSAWLLSLSHIGGKLSSVLISLPCNPTMYFNFLSLLPTNWGERESLQSVECSQVDLKRQN